VNRLYEIDLMTINVDKTVKSEGKSSPKGLSSQKRVPSVAWGYEIKI